MLEQEDFTFIKFLFIISNWIKSFEIKSVLKTDTFLISI